MKVGIDALGVAVPSLCIDLEVLAKARGVDPLKYLDGLGTWRMGVAPIDEDTVTLAARAASMAMKSAQATPEEIGMLVVGTETAVDHSKPVSSFVQGLLGIGTRCRVFETKHACYGGTAALMMALDWIRSGSADGKKALIVCSDIARYGLKTAGEPTQGAGAVALVVSANPRLVELNPAHTGQYASDVHDFWRPLYSKDAFVDGHYSVQCYLDAITGAYKHFKELEPAVTANDFAALAYHVPYGKMAKKAHRQLRALDGDANPDASFDAQVSASLSLPAQVGNIYTGSLYLALTSLLSTSARQRLLRRVRRGHRRAGRSGAGAGAGAAGDARRAHEAHHRRVRGHHARAGRGRREAGRGEGLGRVPFPRRRGAQAHLRRAARLRPHLTWAESQHRIEDEAR
jgi:hydroxymethylglutaryl-CoA synthase